MIRRAISKLTGYYIASWVFLLWSVVCMSAGAVAMHIADEQAALYAISHWEGWR